MDSPLSLILANVVLQDLEIQALSILSFKTPLYGRYVVDIAMMALADQFGTMLATFNSVHPRLQFTLEIGPNNRLNFLDLTIIKSEKFLVHDWFQKPMSFGRYINFHFSQLLSKKKCTIIGLVDRVFFYSHPQFHEKNFKSIIDILIDYKYLINFIFNILRKRLKHNFYKHDDIKTFLLDKNSNKNYKWLTIPYVENISEKIVACLPNMKNEIKTVFT